LLRLSWSLFLWVRVPLALGTSPIMLRTRPFNAERLRNMGFVALVLAIILSIHCSFVFLVCWPQLVSSEAAWRFSVTMFLLFYHVFFGNLIAAFYQCVATDPGLVPPNWGFYMGDETKRRRYCKMCNVWKPDRTHHCSICNRCILNMDHHCPWINNCVGFYNRKFFMQLLLYVYVSLLLILVPALVFFIMGIVDMCYGGASTWQIVECVIVGIATCMTGMLLATLTNFVKFHLKLVMQNYTTIEHLEREDGAKSKFDIGRLRNWEQVFGSNKWMWWAPMHTSTSRPVGDGVRWRVHYTRVIDEDEAND